MAKAHNCSLCGTVTYKDTALPPSREPVAVEAIIALCQRGVLPHDFLRTIGVDVDYHLASPPDREDPR